MVERVRDVVAPFEDAAVPDEGRSYFCPQCGYDLRGQTVRRCPECGGAYDEVSLDSQSRRVFHQCIGCYLGAVTPLVVSIALSLAFASRLETLGIPCAAFPIFLLVPMVAHWMRDWMMHDTWERRRRGRWAWDIENLCMPGGVMTLWVFMGFVFRVSSWRYLVAPVESAFLLVGVWRIYAGANLLRALRACHQDQALAGHRIRSLERCAAACNTLMVLAVLSWLALFAA